VSTSMAVPSSLRVCCFDQTDASSQWHSPVVLAPVPSSCGVAPPVPSPPRLGASPSHATMCNYQSHTLRHASCRFCGEEGWHTICCRVHVATLLGACLVCDSGLVSPQRSCLGLKHVDHDGSQSSHHRPPGTSEGQLDRRTAHSRACHVRTGARARVRHHAQACVVPHNHPCPRQANIRTVGRRCGATSPMHARWRCRLQVGPRATWCDGCTKREPPEARTSRRGSVSDDINAMRAFDCHTRHDETTNRRRARSSWDCSTQHTHASKARDSCRFREGDLLVVLLS